MAEVITLPETWPAWRMAATSAGDFIARRVLTRVFKGEVGRERDLRRGPMLEGVVSEGGMSVKILEAPRRREGRVVEAREMS